MPGALCVTRAEIRKLYEALDLSRLKIPLSSILCLRPDRRHHSDRPVQAVLFGQ